MIHSLWVRLLMAFMLVLGVLLAGVSIFVSQNTTSEFRGYVERRSEGDFRRLVGGMSRIYGESQGWSGAQGYVERMAQFTGEHIVVADTRGVVVADSQGNLTGQSAAGLPGGEPIIYREATVGRLYLNLGQSPSASGPPRGFLPPPPTEEGAVAFLAAVNRSLLLSAGVATLLALGLTLVLSRRILGPVEALTSAARALERGNLAQRVEVTSQDEVGELAKAFNSMAGSLARNEQLRKNMVTDVAHELRTPLSNIRGYLEAMRDGVMPSDRQTLDSVHEEAVQLSRLVDDLQELSMAEAGQLKLDRSPTDLAEVVDRNLRASAAQATAKGVSLERDLPPEMPLVEMDPGRIGQVLRNLISNALGHTSAGGKVTVGAYRMETEVQLWVADTGSGILPEHLPHIFERFYRVDPSRTRSTGGSGIGLTISRQLVEAHGGRIWAESEPGSGSTFQFTLPLPAATPTKKGAAALHRV